MSDPSTSEMRLSGPLRTAAGRTVESLDASERRRIALVIGVPVLFWLVVELAANLGFAPLIAAAALAAFLYTRGTEQETLAAAAYGAGLLAVGVQLFLLYQGVTGGSTDPVADAAVRLIEWPAVGAGLIALGIWIRRTEL